MGETVCWVLALFLFFYFRDFAIVNLNLSSNFVIEHFRRTDFHTVLIAYDFRLYQKLNHLKQEVVWFYVVHRMLGQNLVGLNPIEIWIADDLEQE